MAGSGYTGWVVGRNISEGGESARTEKWAVHAGPKFVVCVLSVANRTGGGGAAVEEKERSSLVPVGGGGVVYDGEGCWWAVICGRSCWSDTSSLVVVVVVSRYCVWGVGLLSGRDCIWVSEYARQRFLHRFAACVVARGVGMRAPNTCIAGDLRYSGVVVRRFY